VTPSGTSPDAPTFDPDARGGRTLVVVAADGFFARELPAEARIVVGRALECDVRIDDPAVSRRHAVLDIAPSTLALVVESKTGRTRIDGRDVLPGGSIPFELGQVVEIGGARLVVRRDAAATAARAARPADSIDVAARTDMPVLLLGETGAGKEVAMRRIVAGSRRAGAPVVHIPCASAGDADLDLDGAKGGTAFLDEITDLSPALQTKLLRVLEGGEVRVIASTNKDLRALASRGAFREDLYFRLAGVLVTVPPLRERAAEISRLARAVVDELAAREGRPAPAISDAALALLASYRWPGNVRELRHVLERALLAAKDVITPQHVELMPPAPAAAAATAPTSASTSSSSPSTTPIGPAENERARIVEALARANGNQKEAARLLGMTRRMLMYRLDTYSIPRPRKR
jgi:DNA-binding NtrC family response regulator